MLFKEKHIFSQQGKKSWYHCSILKIPKGILKNEEKDL